MLRRQFLNTTLAAMAAGFAPIAGSAGNARAARGYIRTNWSRDPYSFGSYSYIAKGARRKDHVALARPVADRLYFAGEATHPTYNSTVHAAYETGLSAADAVAKTQARTVGVIGAGVSGMTAAQALFEQGYDVVVLEARNRIGGRVWTDNRLGLPLDLGASWIHGINGNPVFELSRKLGVETEVTDDSFVMRGGDGRRMSSRDAPDWLEEVLTIQHSAGAADKDINSRAYWLDKDYGGEDVVFPGGYAQLFDAFSDEIDMRLNWETRKIELVEGGVRLHSRASKTVQVDALIVTLPLGVLKQGSVEFDPPLPPQKSKAIASLGMGVLDKVYLKYDDVFWDKDVTWIATPENGLPQGQFNQWLNLYPYIGEPVILAFNGAQPARDLAKLSDRDVVAKAQQTLELAYP